MINPADLNDPVKAEAFLRETIAELTSDGAVLEFCTVPFRWL